MLRLESEGHSFFDLDRMVERPDARNHRRIVLCKTKSMAPKICRRLVLVFVAPSLHRRRPFERDVTRRGPGFDRADRIVEPLERDLVGLFLLLGRLLTDAIGAVIAGFVAVP